MKIRKIIVTATTEDGEVLDRTEMGWDEEAWPVTKVGVVPHNGRNPVVAQHPAQAELSIGAMVER